MDLIDAYEKPGILFDLLIELKDPVLIYCSSPDKATKLSIDFFLYCKQNNKPLQETSENDDIIEWIKENIHEKWTIVDLFKSKIGIHHGAIPRHLGSSLVDNFNERKLQYLFCTSTLIEGVNTSAKNIVLFDKKKGRKAIDYFDFKNIAGRAGRFIQYFIGNVYNMESEPEQLELDVDIPIIEQDNAPEEILINIDEEDLELKSKEKLERIRSFEPEFQLLLKKHSTLPFDGLIFIYNHISQNRVQLSRLISWTGYPTYKQLMPVVELCWNHLLRTTDSKADVKSAKQLTTLAIQYGIYKSTAGIIKHQFATDHWIKVEPDEQSRINKLSYYILNIQRFWFDYKLPKLLIAVSDIQNIVFTKHNLKKGDYKFYATELENGFMPHLINTLKDYNIPASVYKKIQFPESFNSDQELLNYLKDRVDNKKLNKYEIEKIKNA